MKSLPELAKTSWLGGIDVDQLILNDGEDVNSNPDGNNIVIGDSGYIDWTANDTGRFYAADTPLAGTLSGDDMDADDIDRVFSTENPIMAVTTSSKPAMATT